MTDTPPPPKLLEPGALLGGALFGSLLERVHSGDRLPAGTRVGPFRIEAEIGRGGMGVVYRAERDDGEYQQTVAIKTLHANDGAQNLALFRQERQLLARLVHPNIARMLDGGQLDDGRLWFALDLVEGKRIDHWCRDHRLPVAARLALFRQACEAVAFAHARLAIHRDIKPSNILVSNDAEVKLLDFGIAALLDQAGVAIAPTPALTPGFASPEQERGEAATTASDVWQLGRLLAALVMPTSTTETGAPTATDTATQAANDVSAQAETQATTQALNTKAALASAGLARPADPDLAAIITKATAHDPDHRYGTVAELINDLDRHLQRRPVLARHGGRAYRLGRFVSRKRWAVAGVGLAVATLVAVSIVFTVSLARQRDAAEREAERANAVLAFLNDELLAAANPYEFGADARVIDVLERARDRLNAGAFSEAPQVERALRQTIGTGLSAVDRYAEAANELQRAMALSDAANATPELRLATREALADNAFSASDYSLAQRRYQELVDELGAMQPVNAVALFRLRLGAIQAFRLGGAVGASIGKYETLIAEMRAALPVDAPLLVQVLGSFGDTLREHGDLPRAIKVLEPALASSVRVYGDEHPITLNLRQNLAVTYRHAGQLQMAITLQTRIVATSRQQFGDEHQETLNARNELASMLQDAKRHAEAETIFREVLAARERLLGERHQDTRDSLNNLGLILSLQGKLEEAEPLYRRALAIEREVLGPDHLGVLILDHNLASLERKRGKYAAAEARHREVLAGAARTLDKDRPEHGLFRVGLAQTLQAAGRYPEAAQEFEIARAQLVAAYGKDHPRIAAVDKMRANLAKVAKTAK